MSSNSETISKEILERKPYVTRQEVGILLGKQGRNLDKKLLQLLRKKELISLKKGLYSSRYYLARYKGTVEEFIANVLYLPSYLSLEYVLQNEGLIPESVYTYTSITLKTTRTFTNEVGNFSYRHLKPKLFTGFTYESFRELYKIKIASRAKALFDWLYFIPMVQVQKNIAQVLNEDLRINWNEFTSSDRVEFARFTALADSPKMNIIQKVINRIEL